ncbi:MAG: glycosyltransferase family 4 protein [Clostridia bacterium]|nr:glycosyltransferase family 4 protein [Clostridia bacterium]
MKILKLSPYYAPERISSSHLSTDLERAYIDAGFETEVYCPTPTRGISDEEFKRYKTVKYEEKYDGQIKIHRFSMFREGRNPIGRALRYVLVNLIQYHKGTHAKDIDVIMAGSTPPTQGILCGMVKNRLSKKYGRGVPFIYNLQDVFPDSLITAGLAKKGGLLWKIGRKIEDRTYRYADKIIVISEDIKQNIMEKGVPEEKIRVISNWINTEAVQPVNRYDNPLGKELGIDPDRFTVVYAGNLGLLQGVDTLIRAAERLQDQPIDFLIFGRGAAEETLKAQAADLKNVKFYPLQPAERVAEVYSLGDVCTVLCNKGAGGSAVPSKTWTIMACSTPIVASFDTDSELARVLDETGAGLCVEPEDDAALADALRLCCEKMDQLDKLGANGRAYVEENLSAEICTAKYIEVIKEG